MSQPKAARVRTTNRGFRASRDTILSLLRYLRRPTANVGVAAQAETLEEIADAVNQHAELIDRYGLT